MVSKMINSLELIETWLRQEIAPLANKIDCQPQALKTALQLMGDRSLLALKVPTKLGGAGLPELDYRRLQIMMARNSGALTFLQTQHQTAMGMLAKSKNEYLKQEWVLDAIRENILVGVGFSHLRRLGTPTMKASQTKEGYLLTGEVPWITGYDFFDYFICGATLTDGQELYAILPFKNQSQDESKITITPPMELIAVSATNTVTAKIDNWFVADQNIVDLKPVGSIEISSRQNILNHGFFALGCAYAGLDILLQLREKKQLDFLQESWQSLHLQVQGCEKRAIASMLGADISYQEKLKLRAESINLAQRCSMAGVIASSGAANYLNSSAGRVYREALLFSISGQTTEVMEASLKQLTDNR